MRARKQLVRNGGIVLAVVVTLALAAGLTRAQSPDGEVTAQAAVGTAFTYQGQLTYDGSPANGEYDFEFTLYDAPTGTGSVGSPVTVGDEAVTDGLFTVRLDFGSGAFNGDARWLGIGVKRSGETDYEDLGRQELTAAPYALHALEAPWSGLTGVPADLADGDDTGSDWSLTGNGGTTPGPHFLGTTDDRALQLHVNGARILRLEPDATSPNLIGGYSGNSVSAGVYGATIGGGGANGDANRVTDHYGTVAGGQDNQAGDSGGSLGDRSYATVGGGHGNIADGYGSVVAGGYINNASGDWSAVVGGYGNDASALVAIVGGGNNNSASGDYAAIPGGRANEAVGAYSFAAGRQAKANHAGAFVWADHTDAEVASTAEDQFSVRASGGVLFFSSSDLSTGMYLAPGSEMWTPISASDRNLKENFTSVDGQAVLANLARIPITTWNYKAGNPEVLHMSPTAQDFHAAFGLGEDDKHLNALDTNGVGLAAIQGLYQLSQEQAARIDNLEATNAAQQEQIDDLETRLAALETAPGNGPRPWQSNLLPGAGALLAGLGLVWVVQRESILKPPEGGRR